MNFTACPRCGKHQSARAKLSLEFFGGEILCAGCGAILHINHSLAWWLIATPIELWLLLAMFVVGGGLFLGWWIAPLLVLFVAGLGMAVGYFSPFKVVQLPSAKARGEETPRSGT